MAEDDQSRRTNTRVFGIILIVLQVAVTLIYGICGLYTVQYVNMGSIFLAITLAILTVAGISFFIKVSDLCSPIIRGWLGRVPALPYL